uniref:Uncharacterized protein n=1 Tax=Populus davidiana TaxID=266767 RepID=A0A6M2E7P9_9ROSI
MRTNVWDSHVMIATVNESSIWVLGQVPMVINSAFDIVRIGQGLIASSPILYGSLANMKSISNRFIISPPINVYMIVILHANKLVNNQGKREKRKDKLVQCTRHQGPGTLGLGSRISASSAMRNLGSHFNATGFGDTFLHVGSRICPVYTFPIHSLMANMSSIHDALL